MNKKALFKHIFSLLLFGMNGVFASHIPTNSYEIVLFRTLLGSILLFVLFKFSGGRFHIKNNRKDFLFIVFSGIAMGTSWMFLYEAYRQIGVSIGSLLYYCGPVIVMILSPLMFKEKLTMPKIVGFLIVAFGVVLVNGKISGEKGNFFGVVCGLMSAVTYFFMVTLNKKSKNIVGMENSVIRLIVSFLVVFAFIGAKRHFVISIPQGSLLWILLIGFLGTGVGCYLFFSTISRLPVQTVAVCGYLELISAVVFAAIFLGEKMTIPQIVGTICVIGGAMFGELKKAKKTKRSLK